MIKQAKASEVRGLAHELFDPIILELREEVEKARAETRAYRQELMAVTVRLTALENNAQVARRRLDQRTDAVMKAVSDLENVALAARQAS